MSKSNPNSEATAGDRPDAICSVDDTPRTDEGTLTEPYLVRELSFEVVMADFSRQLERELNAANAENERLMGVIGRARTEFFRDGADGMAAANMLSALNDA
jgi:hypothetical protein